MYALRIVFILPFVKLECLHESWKQIDVRETESPASL